jgi:biopolymer transport protein ExbD
MFGRKKKKKANSDFVEPDLPITPMLDMSFQLLAFFITTFNPTPSEGHLDMSLPKVEGGPSTETPPPSLDDDNDELVVTIEANDRGEISQIRMRAKEETEGRPLGSDSAALFEALKKRLAEKKKAAKIKLEMADGLVYKIVIKLMDEITRAGYRQVAPALHGKK